MSNKVYNHAFIDVRRREKISRFLEIISEIISVPIVAMNIASGIIGGIWLLFFKEWHLIVFGILWAGLAHQLLAILMCIRIPIESAVLYSIEKKIKPLQYLFGFLSILFTNVLILVSCAFAFFYCLSHVDTYSFMFLTPYLLWSWGMAINPWRKSLSPTCDNEIEMLTIFLTALFYFLILASFVVNPTISMIIVFIFIVTFVLILPAGTVYYSAISDDRDP
ncbi:hypothetical protein [Anoxynatronum sibiricum]|uniref:Uncharacterized protein n=1 Tax=Anoxynatronum sibiricum TaxID=210623 RepID=A0ABU9VXJ0_9CLOT